MTTLQTYLDDQKKKNPTKFENFNSEYEDFKLEVLGKLIRKIRKQKELTQSQLAELIHTKKQAFST